jgi:hypothetical protein
MKNPDIVNLKKLKNPRTANTVDEILEAAKLLSDAETAELINARALSKKSGYSVGTIYRYFKKIDHIFLDLFLWRIKKSIALAAQVIETHQPHHEVGELVASIVDAGMAQWSSKNPEVIKLVIRYFFKNAKEPEKFNTLLDDLIPLVFAVQKRDQTDTFRSMTVNELRFQVRALQMAIRNPFLEGDAIAGTDEHRRLAIDMGMRLFSKSPIGQ